MFDLHITPLLLVAAGILLLCTLYLLLGFRSYISRVRKAAMAEVDPADGADLSYPSVSVIVYSEDDAENLETLLPQILNQDYPAPFEVIVVNDGAVAATKDVIGRLEQMHSNLYMTFTPLESRALSRKKLALTLGIKAARYEVILNTTGGCQVESGQWLRTICRHFALGKEVVIGYSSRFVPEDIRNPWKRLHAFDTVWTAVEYLSWALAGRPYRGDCHNLAYRRSLFFRNKGFSKSLHMKYGDDDVFVNEIASGANTAVEISQTARVMVVDRFPSVNYKADKMRYDYTGRHLRTMARTFFGSCSVAWWLAFVSAVALGWFGWPSVIPAAAALVVLSILWLVIMLSWRSVSRALWSRSLLLTVPWLMFWHPIYNFYYRLKGFVGRGRNLTWG